jgi:hypothetical protein
VTQTAEARRAAPIGADVLGAFAVVTLVCAADVAGIVRRPPGVPIDAGLLLFLAIGASLGGLFAAAVVLARGAVGRALSRWGAWGAVLAGGVDVAALNVLGVHLQDPRALAGEVRGLVLLGLLVLGGIAAWLARGPAWRGRAVAVTAIVAGLLMEHQLRWQGEVWLRLALDVVWVASGAVLLRPVLARFGEPRTAGALALAAVLVLAGAGSAVGGSESARRALWGRSSQVYGWLFVVGKALDRDGDGAVGWLGGHDCDPARASVFPGATEQAGNDRDDNCRDGDGAPAAAHSTAVVAIAARPPDLLLLSIDSLRWDVADSLTDLPRAIGPHARLTRAVSPSAKTTRTLAAVLRGRPVRQVRLDTWPGVRGEALWRDRSPTLGHALAPRGYRVVTIPTDSYLDPRYGVAAGFESVYAAAHEARGLELAWSPFARDRMRTAPGLEVLLRLARSTPGPLCAWIHAMEPHFPFYWGAKGKGPWSTEGLSRSVREVDRQLARFLEAFARVRGRRPVVAVFGDHGEEIWEHGGSAHGTSVHAEQVRVGLWLGGPGVPEGTWDAPVSVSSVAPTLAELGGAEVPRSMTEPSLLPALQGRAPWPALAVSEASAAGRDWVGYTGPRYRLLVEPEHDLVELYDADRDPLELHDLAAERPSVLRAALRDARRWDEAH